VTLLLFGNLVLYFRDILFVVRNRVFWSDRPFIGGEVENEFSVLLSSNILSMTVREIFLILCNTWFT
jgi:hypothetical protein